METVAFHRRLAHMAVFAHVVELQSFSATAEAIGVSKSAVSKRVAEIERSLGVQLLHRTTRRLKMTEAGAVYYQSCARVVAEAESIERTLGELQQKPLGTLRINAPVAYGSRHVVPVLAEFLQQHPDLRAELVLQDDYVDLIQGGFDLAIRIGALADSSLIARRIAPISTALYASRDYLKRWGVPTSPRELQGHEFVIYSLATKPRSLTLVRAGKRHRVQINGRLVCNNGSAIRAAVLAGLGIGILPEFYVTEDLERGQLIALLKDYTLPSASVHAVYPAGTSLSAKQRLFTDYLVTRWKQSNRV